jgi:hypothetical protein
MLYAPSLLFNHVLHIRSGRLFICLASSDYVVLTKVCSITELCGERRVKNIVFTSGDGKNHEWRRPRVVFGVPTSENNVFALLKQAQ